MRTYYIKIALRSLYLVLATWMLTGCGIYLIGQALNDDDDWSYKSSAINLGEIDWEVDNKCIPNDEIPEHREVQEGEVTLKRHSQRVIRYGCDSDGQPDKSNVLSDKWEEVEKPNMTYYLYPVNLTSENLPEQEPWYRDVRGISFNRSTCSSDNHLDSLLETFLFGGLNLMWESFADVISGRTGPRIKFEIDLAKHMSDMKVREGLNVITYEFMGPCKDQDSDECIDGTRFLENGVLVLTVNYDLKEKGEIKEVKFIDECRPEEQ